MLHDHNYDNNDYNNNDEEVDSRDISNENNKLNSK